MTEAERSRLTRLRIAAENVYASIDGRLFIDQLLEDLGLHKGPNDGNEVVLHAFAMRFMRRNFGLYLDGEDDDVHRTRMTEALMSAAEPLSSVVDEED